MEVIDAVYLIGRIDSEGNTIELLVADDAGEAGGMVRLASGTQDTVQYGLMAHTALL